MLMAGQSELGQRKDDAITGGCLCGAIRFEIAAKPDDVVVCHCPDCRRATGAQSVAWLFLPLEHYQLTKGAPATFNSSPGVTRSFCGHCGTTLSWVGVKQPGRIDVTVGSLDEPAKCKPTRAVYRRHRLPWASLV